MSGRQLLQLVTEMRRAMLGGSEPQKTAWQNHRALGAAETAFRDCLDALEDEVAIQLCQRSTLLLQGTLQKRPLCSFRRSITFDISRLEDWQESMV